MQELYRRHVMFSALKTILPAQAILEAEAPVCELCSLVYSSLQEARDRLISASSYRSRPAVSMSLFDQTQRSNPQPRTDFQPLPSLSVASSSTSQRHSTPPPLSSSLQLFADDEDALLFVDAPILPLHGARVDQESFSQRRHSSELHHHHASAPDTARTDMYSSDEQISSSSSKQASSVSGSPRALPAAIPIANEENDTEVYDDAVAYKDDSSLPLVSSKSQQSATTASAVSEDTHLFQEQGWF
jgi:hypothetical protein